MKSTYEATRGGERVREVLESLGKYSRDREKLEEVMDGVEAVYLYVLYVFTTPTISSSFSPSHKKGRGCLG